MADPADPKLPHDSSSNPALLALRQRIDALDRELLDVLNRRMQVVVEVGELKKHEGSPVFRPERE
ncbi:MAG TPA: chorismate mutase, partial [Aquabacterium sp.]|nr:chorismate mutase [Aquabacterium sp.]